MAAISIKNLSFSYAQAKEPTLRDVSFEVQPGQVTAILGANGAGKSTLGYALAGYIPHFYRGAMQGSVIVDGLDTAKSSLSELVTRVGMVFQNPFNQISGAKLTVEEEIAFGLENLGIAREEMRERVARALALFDLTGAAKQSPYALSGGQQQRLALASIFAMEPPILVLDEPTSQLDPAGTREVMESVAVLASRGMTIVLIEHKLEWVAMLAARVIVLAQGTLAANGTVSEALPRANEWGLNETQYEQTARMAREAGLVTKGKRLPLTLEQAREFFTVG